VYDKVCASSRNGIFQPLTPGSRHRFRKSYSSVVLEIVQQTTSGGEEALTSGPLVAEDQNGMTRRRRDPLSPAHACLRERFGTALQRQRNHRGISQTKLAELANLSPKYVGEIERGEANVSIDLQERLCVALDWYPFELWVSHSDTLAEGTRTVLAANLQHIAQLAQAGVRTLQAMDAEAGTAPQKPKRGRPRTRQPAGTGQLTDG
jgi:transcriptional regulator with XRE-family HTH domain